MAKLRAAAISEIGKVRHLNEDRCLFDVERGIFGVADGVGGLPYGEQAAQTASDAILELMAPGADEAPDLAGVLNSANERVAALGKRISPHLGIATTLTMGCARGGRLHLAHIGDSRCYRWSGERMERLTRDHTVENEARGLPGGLRARFDPREAHALTRCLGVLPMPRADLSSYALEPGHRFLFCTDGVTNLLSDEELGRFAAGPADLRDILRELIASVLSRGAIDNATAVLLACD